MPEPLSREQARAHFPGLAGPDVLLDNAGGSQVPSSVVDRAQRYFRERYVQLGADYARSRAATATVDRARAFTAALFGAERADQVLLGPSTSDLLATLAEAHARADRGARTRVVVATGGHEANVGPWFRRDGRGLEVVPWAPRADGRLDLDALPGLLDERTRLVALPHVSNLLGAEEPVAEVTRVAHAAGARVVVDGVAYAPHQPMAVTEWGVDWYAFSMYKVYGPHLAALYGSDVARAEVEGPNHFFVPRDRGPYEWELGGPGHEGCAAWLGCLDYLRAVAGDPAGDPDPTRDAPSGDRATVERAFARLRRWELPLQSRLVEFLAGRDDVTLVGPDHAEPSRFPTVSFTHATRSSRSIAEAANAAGLGIRYGHFYSHRLAVHLGLEPDDGVVRASLVHTNTDAEVERLLAFLDEHLA